MGAGLAEENPWRVIERNYMLCNYVGLGLPVLGTINHWERRMKLRSISQSKLCGKRLWRATEGSFSPT